MFLCYVDESGDEAPLRTRRDPPVLVLGGLIVAEQHAKGLIWDFLQLKKDFNDSLRSADSKLSDVIAMEVKGAGIRSDLRSDSRRRRRRAVGILDKLLSLLETHQVQVIAEVHVKGQRTLGRWVYPQAVARLAEQLEVQLRAAQSRGIMVLDARTKSKNVPSVARITTKRFRTGGDEFPHLVESPVFGHSDAHVILQIADLLVSALLFPMACAGFCLCLLDNVHPSDQYLDVRARFGERVRLLEHRYLNAQGDRVGGIRVFDHMNRQPTRAMLEPVEFTLR